MIKTLKVRRVRAGLYSIVAGTRVWSVERRPVDPGYGGGYAWFAQDVDDRWSYLDPLPRFKDVKRALSAFYPDEEGS
jgi:hypothetical protein